MRNSTFRFATLAWLALWGAAGGGARAESAPSLVAKGNKAYAERRYEEALNAYRQASKAAPEEARIWFNQGDALYRQGKFSEAIDAFEQAAIRSRDRSLEARSKFNQGNASFRQGVQMAQANPAQALASVENSVRFYQDALKLDPGLNDARHNIEVARHVIERLRRQMKQQPRQNQQNNKQKPQSKSQQQQKQAGQQEPSGSERQQPAGNNQQQQRQQEQARRGQQKAKPQPGEKPEDVLRQERENRRLRQLHAAVTIKPVDKDW